MSPNGMAYCSRVNNYSCLPVLKETFFWSDTSQVCSKMEENMQEKRPICGRGLDVVCIDGETLQATEFVMYVPLHEIEACKKLAREAGEELQEYAPTSSDLHSRRETYVLKADVMCNGELVVSSLTGASEDIAVIEPSGRVAFVKPDGGHSYFASSEILSDMNLSSLSTNLIELKVRSVSAYIVLFTNVYTYESITTSIHRRLVSSLPQLVKCGYGQFTITYVLLT